MKKELTYDEVKKEMETTFGHNYEFHAVFDEIELLLLEFFKGGADVHKDQDFLNELKKETIEVFTPITDPKDKEKKRQIRSSKYRVILKKLGLNTFALPIIGELAVPEKSDPPINIKKISKEIEQKTATKYTDIINRILDFELSGNQIQTLHDRKIKRYFKALVKRLFIPKPGDKAMKQKELQLKLNRLTLNLDESAISRLISPIKNRYIEISLHDSSPDKYKTFLHKSINSLISPSKEVKEFITLSEEVDNKVRDMIYQRANAKKEYPETWKEMWVAKKSKNNIISCSDYHKDCEMHKKKNHQGCIKEISDDLIEQFHIIVSDSFLSEFKEKKVLNPIIKFPINCQRLNMNGLIISHFEKSLLREIKKNWNVSKYRKEEIKNNAQRSGGLRPTRITKRR
ncbi:MAG: hypothetical protein KA146_02390 [Leptospiraceae bacterium]|nr:hypothetical protein [Leptospiraceae bacterium]